MSEPIVLRFFGPACSKKNTLLPRKNKKGRGLMYSKKTQAQLAYLKEQIPPEVRGLNLVNPDITVQFRLPANNAVQKAWDADWDGYVTSVQDILVFFGILADDKFSQCNGRKVIEPAELIEGLVQETIITLIPKCVDKVIAPEL